MEKIAVNRIFDGLHEVWTHDSAVCGCTMRFAIYLPPQAADGKVPALYWLSGLTCTDENFGTKAGAQRVAAALGIALARYESARSEPAG
jgi:S-formylglutathione hydrolase